MSSDDHEAAAAASSPSGTETSGQTVPGGEPLREVECGGVVFTLLGTAHVSKQSAEEVAGLLEGERFDAVAIELDAGRHASMTRPDSWENLDLLRVIRTGRAGMLMASLALGAFQQRLADQVGIEPGEEMRTAMREAAAQDLPLLLVDRNIGTTLKRVTAAIPWYRRLMLMSGLLVSTVSSEKIEPEEIERLKEGDILEATFSEFAEGSAEMYRPLISERDEFMALRLVEETAGKDWSRVLVVLGAGHLAGTAAHLNRLDADGAARAGAGDRLAELAAEPPPSVWPKLLPWLIVVLVLLGFVIGFLRGPELGFSVVRDWFLINGVLAGIGAVVALAHPLTVLASIVGAPFTSLNPLIGVGFVAAAVQLWLQRPRVADFSTLRRDTGSLRGWYRNRVSRTLLVFMLTTLGSAAGTWLAGARIFVRLTGGDG